MHLGKTPKKYDKQSYRYGDGVGGCSPFRVLDLLGHKVEGVPARVGEQGGVEGQGDIPWVCGGTLERGLKVGCVAWWWHNN